MNEELKKEILELLNELRQQDSIEIGNAKTGVVKVYFNGEKPEEAQKKLTDAIKLLRENRGKVLNGD